MRLFVKTLIALIVLFMVGEVLSAYEMLSPQGQEMAKLMIIVFGAGILAIWANFKFKGDLT